MVNPTLISRLKVQRISTLVLIKGRSSPETTKSSLRMSRARILKARGTLLLIQTQ